MLRPMDMTALSTPISIPDGTLLQGVEVFACIRMEARLTRRRCSERSKRADKLRMGDAGLLSNSLGTKAGKSDLQLAICRGCDVGRAHRGLPPLPPEVRRLPVVDDQDGVSSVGRSIPVRLKDHNRVRDSLRVELRREAKILRWRGASGPPDGGPSIDSYRGWGRRFDLSPETIRVRHNAGLPMREVLFPGRRATRKPGLTDGAVAAEQVVNVLREAGLDAGVIRSRGTGHFAVVVQSATLDEIADLLPPAQRVCRVVAASDDSCIFIPHIWEEEVVAAAG